MTTKWSQEAWQAALPAYEAITKHPFINGLADGTLSRDRFEFYLRQDARYIEIYSRVLAHIASRAVDADMLSSFLSFAADGVAVEQAMHATYLSHCGPAEELSPACSHYTSFLLGQQAQPVEVEAAAILPCFWVYWAVGKELLKKATLDGNPYRMWIETYSDPAFDLSNARAIELCDRLAEKADEGTRRAMTEVFVRATQLEWMFWDSAFRKEMWPV